MIARGHCLCGAVAFTAEDVDTSIHVCHCSMCRRWSGGPAFSVSVRSVAFEGGDHIVRFDSSAWAERGFCDRCGTSLFYRLKKTDQYFLNMGAFEDQSSFVVTDEIYIDEKPAGYAIAGDHPRLTGEQFLASLNKG
jgi:hypothetical protein